MQLALAVAGFVAEVLAWRLVACGRASLWVLVVPVIAALGVASAIARPPVSSGRASAVAAITAGITAGVALYLGTLVFVALAVRWAPFRDHVVDRYRLAGEIPLWLAVVLSALIAAPGEELFWRGLVQPRLQASMPVLTGPALAWIGYVIANAASGSLPFVAGAAVGGAVWAGLALWTKGVLASILCHTVWTTAMLVRPPRAGREMLAA
jgi:uncharacterized protein